MKFMLLHVPVHNDLFRYILIFSTECLCAAETMTLQFPVHVFGLLLFIPLPLLYPSIYHTATLHHSPFYSLAPSVLLLPSFSLFCFIAHNMLMFFLPLYSPGYKLFMQSFTGERHIYGCCVRVTLAPRNNTDVIVIMGIVCLGVCGFGALFL